MEADWEFEVGPDAAGPDAAGLDAPVIDAAWPGLVDLQREPERARDLPEAGLLPGLAEVLIKLNSIASLVRTSKCDVWTGLDADDFDPDELDAPPDHSAHALGCYIDLLPSGSRQWNLPEMAADESKRICACLRAIPLRCCRADLVIRRAFVGADPAGEQPVRLGITAYLTSCGESSATALRTLQSALAAFADALSTTRR